MKELKDYLHLYLGCECEYGAKHFLDGERFVLTVGNIFWAVSHEDEFKPILRPLSDMTEEDYRFMNDGYNDSNKHNIQDQYKWEAEQTRYFLSKHFDIFGLIESGLAIDATTLKKTDNAIKAE